MNRSAKFLAIAALFLILLSFAHAASIPVSAAGMVEKFDRILIDGKEAYTTPNLYDAPVFIASDKYLYGSNLGLVTVKVYFYTKQPGNYSFGLQTNGKSITLKNVDVGKGAQVKDATGTAIRDTQLFALGADFHEITFQLAFNPADIGMQEEFDIIIYDELGKEVARLDPFLSPYNKRLTITVKPSSSDYNALAVNGWVHRIDLNSLTLGSNATTFWDNTLATGYDVRFTKIDGTTELVYKRAQWVDNTSAAFDVNFQYYWSPDSNIYMYFGNPSATNTSNSDLNVLKVDTFEDANILDWNPAYWTVASGTVTSQAVTYYHGSRAMQIQSGGVKANVSPLIRTGDYNVWVRTTDATNGTALFVELQNELGNTGIIGRIDISSSKFKGYVDPGSQVDLVGTNSPQSNTWYKFEIVYNGTTVSYYVYDTNEDLLCSLTGQTPDVTGNAIYFRQYSGISSGFFDDTGGFSYAQYPYTIGTYEVDSGIATDFNYNVKGYLDPESGINSVNVDFNDLSVATDGNKVSWKWYSDSALFSTDQNTTKAYTAAADYNVCLDVNMLGSDLVYYTDMACKTVTVSQAAQALAINYDINHYLTTDVNVGFEGAYTGTASNHYWLHDGVQFGTDRNTSKSFTAGDTDANICFIATTNDANKSVCESYYISEVMVKIPKKESDGTTNITPFALLINTVPSQSYSALVADTNFFLFLDSEYSFEITVDANDALYFDRVYTASTAQANTTIQPYLADAATGTSITIYTQSNVDYTAIGNVTVNIYKNIGGTSVLVESVITDDKGEAFVSGIVNDEYEYQIYYNGILIDTLDITVTSTSIYIQFNPNAVDDLPDEQSINISFIPAISTLLTTDTTLKQVMNYSTGTLSSLRIWIKQVDVNGINPDANLYSNYVTVGLSDGYANSVAIAALAGWDGNQSLRVYVVACFTDGTCYNEMQSYTRPYGIYGTTWTYLTSGIKTDFSCTGDACGFLILVALVVSIFITAWLSISSPLPDMGNHLGLVFIFIFAIFMLIGWVHWALWLMSAIVVGAYSIISREAVK